MRYWYDTEFYENGTTIDLISMAIVAEDGREYYGQALGYNRVAWHNEWLRENVLRHLLECESGEDEMSHRMSGGRCDHPTCPWRSRVEMRDEVAAFLGERLRPPERAEMWGYYSAYDHVALAQLFGTMMDLPPFVPMYTRDLKQWCVTLGDPNLPAQSAIDGREHYALADARWTRRAWEWLRSFETTARPAPGRE